MDTFFLIFLVVSLGLAGRFGFGGTRTAPRDFAGGCWRLRHPHPHPTGGSRTPPHPHPPRGERAHPAAPTTDIGGAAIGPFDGGRGPAQAGTDLVGHDLDDVALVAVPALVLALLEATGDDHPRALLERRRRVLAELGPRDHVEEGHLL